MNIRVFLSEVAGSDEKVIEAIERCWKDRQPFGLKCQRSSVVFIPHLYKAYWLWSDGSCGPVFESTNWKDFMNCVKMQYLSHKTLITTDELVGIAKLIKHEQEQKRLDLLPGNLLPEPGQPTGPLETGN
jgi:hypothetical protein